MLPMEPAADMPISAAAKGNGIALLPQSQYFGDLDNPIGNFDILRTGEMANAISNISDLAHLDW